MDAIATEARIEELYEARRSNDAKACLDCFAETGSFSMAMFRNGGEARLASTGRMALANQLSVLVDTWEWVDRVVLNTFVNGLEAAVRYRLVAKHLPSGETIVTEIMDYIRLDPQLQIVELVEYLDTAMVERLAASEA